MQVYTITELDLDILKEMFEGDLINTAKIEKWERSLPEPKDLYFCECVEKYLDYMCPCMNRL